MIVEIPVQDMPVNREKKEKLISRLSEMDDQPGHNIGEFFHSTPLGSASAILDLLVLNETNTLFGGGCLSDGNRPMVGVYMMTEDDALNRGGIYSYSPGMEVANDNWYFFVPSRCVAMNFKVAKSKLSWRKAQPNAAASIARRERCRSGADKEWEMKEGGAGS